MLFLLYFIYDLHASINKLSMYTRHTFNNKIQALFYVSNIQFFMKQVITIINLFIP